MQPGTGPNDTSDVNQWLDVLIGEADRLFCQLQSFSHRLVSKNIDHVVEAIRQAEATMANTWLASASGLPAAIASVGGRDEDAVLMGTMAVRFIETGLEAGELAGITENEWFKSLSAAHKASISQNEIHSTISALPFEPTCLFNVPLVSSDISDRLTCAAVALLRAQAFIGQMLVRLRTRASGGALDDRLKTSLFTDAWCFPALMEAHAANRAIMRGVAHITAFIAESPQWSLFLSTEEPLPDPMKWHGLVTSFGKATRIPAIACGAAMVVRSGVNAPKWLVDIKNTPSALSVEASRALDQSVCYKATVAINRMRNQTQKVGADQNVAA